MPARLEPLPAEPPNPSPVNADFFSTIAPSFDAACVFAWRRLRAVIAREGHRDGGAPMSGVQEGYSWPIPGERQPRSASTGEEMAEAHGNRTRLRRLSAPHDRF